MALWKILRMVWKLAVAFAGGGLTNRLLIHGPPGGGWVGLIDDFVMIFLASTAELSGREALAATVFFGTIRKMVEDGEYYYYANERQRAVVRKWVRQEYPNHIYLYGRIDVDDLLDLYVSGHVLYQSEGVQSVFQAVEDIFAVVSDETEVFLVA